MYFILTWVSQSSTLFMNVYNNLQNYLSKKYSKQKEKCVNLIEVSQTILQFLSTVFVFGWYSDEEYVQCSLQLVCSWWTFLCGCVVDEEEQRHRTQYCQLPAAQSYQTPAWGEPGQATDTTWSELFYPEMSCTSPGSPRTLTSLPLYHAAPDHQPVLWLADWLVMSPPTNQSEQRMILVHVYTTLFLKRN